MATIRAAASSSSEQLVLALSASKRTYVLREPVQITFTLTNPSDEPITTQFSSLGFLGFCYEDVELRLQYEDTAPFLWQVEKVNCQGGRWGPAVHAPKDSMRATQSIVHTQIDGRAQVAFPKPGRYRATGRVRLGTSPSTCELVFVESPVLEFRITNSRRQDRKLVESLGGEKQLLWLLESRLTKYCAGQPEVACLEPVLRLSRRFEKSAYAPYLAYSVASWLAVDRGPERGGHFSYAADVFLEIRDRWRGHPIARSVLAYLPMALHHAGRQREADEWLDRYLEEYGGEDNYARMLQAEIRGSAPPAAPAVLPIASDRCDGGRRDCDDATFLLPASLGLDADGDGFGICDGDCDDRSRSTYPGAPQGCDGMNSDCNDPRWPQMPENEADRDGDGVRACDGDCNDTDPAVSRMRTEACANGLDDDCNGSIDAFDPLCARPKAVIESFTAPWQEALSAWRGRPHTRWTSQRSGCVDGGMT